MVASLFTKLKFVLDRVLAFFPSPLPRTTEALDAFSEEVLDLYDLKKLPGYRIAIATMILHLKPTVARKSKRYFGLSVLKGEANEVAFQKMEELKAQAKTEQEVAEATVKSQAIAEAARDESKPQVPQGSPVAVVREA